jgi:hypothetical protein
MTSATENVCEHCEHGEPMYPSVADCEIDHMEIIVENDRMIVELGNEDAVFRINRCPMCGRDLREVDHGGMDR